MREGEANASEQKEGAARPHGSLSRCKPVEQPSPRTAQQKH